MLTVAIASATDERQHARVYTGSGPDCACVFVLLRELRATKARASTADRPLKLNRQNPESGAQGASRSGFWILRPIKIQS